MESGVNGSRENGRMSLIEAATLIERMQGRAAHSKELEAMQIARDALLTIVSEGFVTLKERIQTDGFPVHNAAMTARLPINQEQLTSK